MESITISKDTAIGQKFIEKFKDENNETDISKAGVWNLMDAMTGKDNSKFSPSEAQEELAQRGL